MFLNTLKEVYANQHGGLKDYRWVRPENQGMVFIPKCS